MPSFYDHAEIFQIIQLREEIPEKGKSFTKETNKNYIGSHKFWLLLLLPLLLLLC